MLFRLGDATEGLRDEGASEQVGGRWFGWWDTRGRREAVDEFEDEEAREGAAEVGDAARRELLVVRRMWETGGKGKARGGQTYVARRVMYVPPMTGSAIFA